MQDTLVPARFLTMLGHFVALLMMFYTRVRSISGLRLQWCRRLTLNLNRVLAGRQRPGIAACDILVNRLQHIRQLVRLPHHHAVLVQNLTLVWVQLACRLLAHDRVLCDPIRWAIRRVFAVYAALQCVS